MQAPLGHYLSEFGMTQVEFGRITGKDRRQVHRWLGEGAVVEYNRRTGKPMAVMKSKSWVVWRAK